MKRARRAATGAGVALPLRSRISLLEFFFCRISLLETVVLVLRNLTVSGGATVPSTVFAEVLKLLTTAPEPDLVDRSQRGQ